MQGPDNLLPTGLVSVPAVSPVTQSDPGKPFAALPPPMPSPKASKWRQGFVLLGTPFFLLPHLMHCDSPKLSTQGEPGFLSEVSPAWAGGPFLSISLALFTVHDSPRLPVIPLSFPLGTAPLKGEGYVLGRV